MLLYSSSPESVLYVEKVFLTSDQDLQNSFSNSSGFKTEMIKNNIGSFSEMIDASDTD